MTIDIKIFKMYDDSRIFTKAHETDACFDIYAYLLDCDVVYVEPGETKLIGTGIKLSIPVGYEGVIRPRSGMSLKTTLRVANSPGTIDSGYINEIKIIFTNIGDKPVCVRHGDRIAQIGFRQVPEIKLVEVDDEAKLGSSERGLNGFGSTGK